MCDLFSWIEKKTPEGKEIIFARDSDVHAAFEGNPGRIPWNNVIGHSFIERNILKESRPGREHKESAIRVPRALAASVNRGECDEMAKNNGWAGVRYKPGKGAYAKIDAPWWPSAFLASLKKIKYLDNHGAVDPTWKLFDTRGAVWGAARDAAASVAWDAAWDAVRDAAASAALGAAASAAREAAWNAAREAAGNAALLASCLLAYHNDPDSSVLAYAKKRWNVWEQGYGLFADIGGVFYVYKQA